MSGFLAARLQSWLMFRTTLRRILNQIGCDCAVSLLPIVSGPFSCIGCCFILFVQGKNGEKAAMFYGTILFYGYCIWMNRS